MSFPRLTSRGANARGRDRNFRKEQLGKMKWFETLFRKTRRSGEGASCSLLSMLAPSLLGMTVCLLSLCSLSWAWFNMSVNTGVSTIQSAMVEVAVANNADFAGASLLAGNGKLTVKLPEGSSGGTLYLIAQGNVSKPTYLKVDISGSPTYYQLELAAVNAGSYPVYSISINGEATLSLVCWNSDTPDTTEPLSPFEVSSNVPWPITTTQSDSTLTAAPAKGEDPDAPIGEDDTNPVGSNETKQPTDESKLTEGKDENGQTSEDNKNSEDLKQEQDTEQGGTTGTGTSDSNGGTSGTTGDDVSGSVLETPAAGAGQSPAETPSTGNDIPAAEK